MKGYSLRGDRRLRQGGKGKGVSFSGGRLIKENQID